jgi:hypothetical protein
MADDDEQDTDTNDTALEVPPAAPIAGRFKKGQSGNPGGRSKLDKIVREFMGGSIGDMLRVQRAIALGQKTVDLEDGTKLTLPELKARDINESFKNVTDRGWGKAPQHITINDAPTTSIDLDDKSDEELDELIERMERERAAIH